MNLKKIAIAALVAFTETSNALIPTGSQKSSPLNNGEFDKFFETLESFKSSGQLPKELEALINLDDREETLAKSLKFHSDTNPKKIQHEISVKGLQNQEYRIQIALWIAINSLNDKLIKEQGPIGLNAKIQNEKSEDESTKRNFRM
jgi:hypothetical protein